MNVNVSSLSHQASLFKSLGNICNSMISFKSFLSSLACFLSMSNLTIFIHQSWNSNVLNLGGEFQVYLSKQRTKDNTSKSMFMSSWIQGRDLSIKWVWDDWIGTSLFVKRNQSNETGCQQNWSTSFTWLTIVHSLLHYKRQWVSVSWKTQRFCCRGYRSAISQGCRCFMSVLNSSLK